MAQVGFLRVLSVVRRRRGGLGAAAAAAGARRAWPAASLGCRSAASASLSESEAVRRLALLGRWVRAGACCNSPRSLINSRAGRPGS